MEVTVEVVEDAEVPPAAADAVVAVVVVAARLAAPRAERR